MFSVNCALTDFQQRSFTIFLVPEAVAAAVLGLLHEGILGHRSHHDYFRVRIILLDLPGRTYARLVICRTDIHKDQVDLVGHAGDLRIGCVFDRSHHAVFRVSAQGSLKSFP